MGGTPGSVVTECDVVNGGGEASDGGAVKVISSMRNEGEPDALGSTFSRSMLTVRIGRRVLDLWSDNPVLRARWGISRDPTEDDDALWQWGSPVHLPGKWRTRYEDGVEGWEGQGNFFALTFSFSLSLSSVFSPPSLLQAVALSLNALAISQSLRRRGGTAWPPEAEGRAVPLAG
jgi:hypothetical protein